MKSLMSSIIDGENEGWVGVDSQRTWWWGYGKVLRGTLNNGVSFIRLSPRCISDFNLTPNRQSTTTTSGRLQSMDGCYLPISSYFVKDNRGWKPGPKAYL